ncbi:hypothetical protein [Acinetobacter sp. MD2(2019)]|uniref:hypothetical protein n=1 Tax=Acinetobacter sp. MD2(2019) TaxID=2605273 RepID=UPI002D1F7918|nr:hypothetical protein [Acinetobacter sp. MD2(2019)]MEB3755104.1 hypothetical protein [Acinetobacter sp. MD2(2019)]
MKNESRIEVIGIVAALGMIFLLWLFYPNFLSWMDHSSVSKSSTIVPHNFSEIGNKFGTYGDSYGSLNTLFSGFAFAILIISLFMQRQELKEQRKELEAQRHEIAESNAIAESQRKITEQQAELIKQQIFDSNVQSFYQLFFKYLEEKDRKLQDLAISTVKISGNNLLAYFIYYFEQSIREYYYDSNQILQAELKDLSQDVLHGIDHAHTCTENVLKMGEYFQYIYFILYFIDTHKHLNITENAVQTLMAYQSIHETYCMALFATQDDDLAAYIYQFGLLSKTEFYIDNEILNTLLNRIFKPEAFSVFSNNS